jgi:hypothetical protein
MPARIVADLSEAPHQSLQVIEPSCFIFQTRLPGLLDCVFRSQIRSQA